MLAKITKKHTAVVGGIAFAVLGALSFSSFATSEYRSATADDPERFIPLPELNKADYDSRLLALAHVSTSTLAAEAFAATATTTGPRPKPRLWPVQAVYPNADAILPFKRIVAYYGNFYSKQMGVLGEYPTDQLLAKLASTTAMWEAADPTTPVLPAIQYIAVVAQGAAGRWS